MMPPTKAIIVLSARLKSLHEVSSALGAKFGEAESVKMVWKPTVMAPLDDFDKAETLMRLVDTLDEDDDVQNVFINAEFSDEVAAKLNPPEE